MWISDASPTLARRRHWWVIRLKLEVELIIVKGGLFKEIRVANSMSCRLRSGFIIHTFVWKLIQFFYNLTSTLSLSNEQILHLKVRKLDQTDHWLLCSFVNFLKWVRQDLNHRSDLEKFNSHGCIVLQKMTQDTTLDYAAFKKSQAKKNGVGELDAIAHISGLIPKCQSSWVRISCASKQGSKIRTGSLWLLTCLISFS